MKSFTFRRLLLLLSCVFTLQIVAQTEKVKITGVVLDEDNEPLVGAGVYVQNTKASTYTNAEGAYVLRAPCKEGSVIVFSYIGMKKQLVKYKGQKYLKII